MVLLDMLHLLLVVLCCFFWLSTCSFNDCCLAQVPVWSLVTACMRPLQYWLILWPAACLPPSKQHQPGAAQMPVVWWLRAWGSQRASSTRKIASVWTVAKQVCLGMTVWSTYNRNMAMVDFVSQKGNKCQHLHLLSYCFPLFDRTKHASGWSGWS